MDGNKVICCFCGKNMEMFESVSIQIFPIFNKDESQQLFCHKKCLVEKLHKSIPIHPELLEYED
jgi:hypothetical protein